MDWILIIPIFCILFGLLAAFNVIFNTNYGAWFVKLIRLDKFVDYIERRWE